MARRSFNPTGSQIALAAGVAILAGAAVSDAMKRPSRSKKKRRNNPFDPGPYIWNEDRARNMIRKLVDSGETDRAFVAAEASSRVFGEHPQAGVVTFPPSPGSPPEVSRMWTSMVHLVDDVFVQEGIIDTKEGGQFQWTVHDPLDADYPWEEPSLHPNNYPTPGMFFDVGSPTRTGFGSESKHTLDQTVRRALGSALMMANMDTNLAVGASNTSKRLRRQMRQLILGSAYNDGLYGQESVDLAGGNSHDVATFFVMHEKARGLNWTASHADNLTRMSRGQAPKRTTSLQGEVLEGQRAGSHMLLWIPAVDLAALYASIPSVQPYQWLDGTSTQEPPPSVQRLGIDMSGVSLPGGAGC